MDDGSEKEVGKLRLFSRLFVMLVLGIYSLGWATTARADAIHFDFNMTGSSTTIFVFPVVTFSANGAGNLTLLGDTKYTSQGAIDVSQINPNGSHPSSGTFMFFNSAGDSLFGTYQGDSFGPDASGTINFLPNYTITGGSGLFAGASGSATGLGVTSIFTGTFTLSGSGNVCPVPEPSAVTLLSIAGLFSYMLRRLKR